MSGTNEFGIIYDERYLIDVEGKQHINYRKYLAENELLSIDYDF